jgi:NDP-sugar pyrophosphorylase family protein
MKAVILAAGKGTRMLPLTKDMPKPLIPINGKPFIGYILDLLVSLDIFEVGIIENYLKEQIVSYVNTNYSDKLAITHIDQRQPFGTGHAVLQAKKFVGESEFLLFNGDNYYSVEDVLMLLGKRKMCVAGISHEHPERYGSIELRKDGKDELVMIHEQIPNPPSNIINAGLYFLTPSIFTALEQIKPASNGEYRLTDALNILARQKYVSVYILKDYWLDLGKPEDVPILETFFIEHNIH